MTTEVYEGAPPGIADPVDVVTFEERDGRTTLSILMRSRAARCAT